MGEVVHKEPQNGAEVVLRSGHGDFYRDGRLGVTVAAGSENSDSVRFSKTWQKNMADEQDERRPTYNLCMRETMVLNAAWMSAVVQVQTTGNWWFCSMSERYWQRGSGKNTFKSLFAK